MTRIILLSDTHYQRNWHAILERTMRDIAVFEPDCVVHAGDVGEGLDGYQNMLALLALLDCPRLVLAGNHDLWTYRQTGISTEALWTEVLPCLTRDSGAIWLEGENWIKDGIGVCGSIGWYDYSARDPKQDFSPADYARLKGTVMVDAVMMDWQRTDQVFSDELGMALENRLQALEADSAVREVLVATHVPPFEEGIAREPGNRAWNLANAYFGNLTLGARIEKYAKVRHVISGHTHVGKKATLRGKQGIIEMQVIPADYGHPAFVIVDL